MDKQSQETTVQTIKYFWKFTKPNKYSFFASTFASMVGIIISEVLPPFVIAGSFNRIQDALTTGEEIGFSDVSGYFFIYLLLQIAALIIWRVQVVFAWVFEVNSIQRIAEYSFNHLQIQGQKFHANRFGGALVSQTNKFLGAYERVMDEFTWSIVTGFVALIASIIVLMTVSPVFAIVLLIISILYTAQVFWRVRIQAPYDRALASSESERTAKLADMITNVGTVRAFAGESTERSRFKKQTSETTQTYFSLLKQVFINDIWAHGGMVIIATTAFFAGLVAVTNFDADVGVLFLAVTYTMTLVRRLWEGRRVMRNLSRAFGDASDLTQIMQIEPEIKDVENPQRLHVKSGEIKFNNVTFAFSDAKSDPVFEKLSFEIDGGQKIGLVGHSGGGKTTVTGLVLRFLDIDEGTITIDGVDISKVTQDNLRKSVAYVPQEPLMFHRNIAENISYGKPKATQKEIETAAKKAHAHEFIKSLPDGYKTLVGERGVKLSGGQRQRVAIARAILKDAPILVLDEATSSLDSESEKHIQDALAIAMKDKTTIVIAHRLSTIQKLDRILVLEMGEIVEDGKHKDLVEADGIYSTLWAHQTGGFIEE